MPLSNGRGLQMAPPTQNVQNGRMTSSGGYDLGPSNSYTNNMMDAYNNLRRYRQQRPIQQQQAAPQEPAPDTRGWQQANDFEQGIHSMAEWGERISDPFGYSQKWEETKQKRREGKDTLGDYLGVGVRFAGSLPFSMVGGLAMDPQYIGEALTGKDYSNMYNGLIDNDRLDAGQRAASAGYVALDAASFIPGIGTAGTLGRTAARAGMTAGRRVARTGAEAAEDAMNAARLAQDQAVMTRATARANRFAPQNQRVNVGDDIKNIRENKGYGTDAFDESALTDQERRSVKAYERQLQVEENRAKWSPSERAGNAVMKAMTGKEHPFIGGLAGSAVEEGTQEFFQTMMEDIRGDQENHGRSNINLAGDLEAAAFGAIGGGLFHTGNFVAGKVQETAKNELEKRTIRFANGGDEAAQRRLISMYPNGSRAVKDAVENGFKDGSWGVFSRVADAGGAPTMKVYNNPLEDSYGPAWQEKAESERAKAQKSDVGFSGTMVNDGRMNGAQGGLPARNVMQMVTSPVSENNGVVTDYGKAWLDTIFGDEAENTSAGLDVLNSMRKNALNAAMTGDYAHFKQYSNNALSYARRKGITREFLYNKQPTTNEGPVRMEIYELTDYDNALNVPEEIAAMANADFDGDLAAALELTINAKRDGSIRDHANFLDMLVSPLDNSIVDWGKANLDLRWGKSKLGTRDFSDKLSDNDISLVVSELVAASPRVLAAPTTPLNLTVNGNKVHGKSVIDVLESALKEIANIEDEGVRHKEFSSLLVQLRAATDQNGNRLINVSDLLGIIRQHVRLNKSIPSMNATAESVKKNATDFINKQQDDRYVVTLGYDSTNPSWPSYLEIAGIQLPMATRPEIDPTTGKQIEGAANSNFRSYTKGNFDNSHSNQPSEGMYEPGNEPLPSAFYDVLLQIQLDMVHEGQHDQKKIMKLFNSIVLTYLAARMQELGANGEFSFGENFEIDKLFDDTTIEGLNRIINSYNSAITRATSEGIVFDAVEGPKPKKPLGMDPSVNEVAEFLFPVIADEGFVGEILGSMMNSSKGETLKKNGFNVNQTLRHFFSSYVVMDGLPEQFFDTVTLKSDGTKNNDIRKLFLAMKEVSDKQLEFAEETYIESSRTLDKNGGKDQRLFTKKELKEMNPNLSEEQLDIWEKDDRYRLFVKFNYEMGTDALGALGIYKFGDFLRHPVGKAYMQARTDAKREAIFFGTLFKSLTAPLQGVLTRLSKADELTEDECRDLIEKVDLWYSKASTNNNPVWLVVKNMIDTVKKNDLKDGKFNNKNDYKVFALNLLEIFDGCQNFKTYTAKQMREHLSQSYLGNATKAVNKMPWLTYMRLGFRGYPEDLSIVNELAKADMATSCMQMREIQEVSEEVKEWEKSIEGLSDDEVYSVLDEMSDPMYVEEDPELFNEAIYSILQPHTAALEKARSVEGLAHALMTFRLLNGKTYTTMFDQYTGSITGSMNFGKFKQNRQALMGVVLGKTDPETGHPYRIRIYDPEIEADVWLTHEDIFGLEPGQKAEHKDIIKFIKQNPQIASWFMPAKVTLVGSGSMKIAAITRSKDKSLKDSFAEARNRRNGKDAAGNPVPSNKLYTEKVEKRILNELHSDPKYYTLIVGLIKRLENIDILDREQVVNAANNVKSDLEKVIVWHVVQRASGNTKNSKDVLEYDTGRAIEQSLEMMFETTSIDDIATALSTGEMQTMLSAYEKFTETSMIASIVEQAYNKGKKEKDKVYRDTSDLDNQFGKRAKEVSKSQVKRFMVVHQLIDIFKQEGKANDAIQLSVKKVGKDNILKMFPKNKRNEIEVTIDNLNETNVLGLSFDTEIFEDGDIIIPTIPETLDDYGIYTGMAVLQKHVRATEKFLDDDVIPYLKGIDIKQHYDELEDALRSCMDPITNLVDWEAFRKKADTIEKRFWTKVAMNYFKHLASMEGKGFTENGPDIVKMYMEDTISNIVDSLDVRYGHDELTKIKTNYDGYRGKKPPEKLDFQFFKPGTMNAMAISMDLQVSASSQEGIGMNGTVPNFLSAAGFGRVYECDAGRRETADNFLQQQSRLSTGGNQPNYIIEIESIDDPNNPGQQLSDADMQDVCDHIVQAYGDSTGSRRIPFRNTPAQVSLLNSALGIGYNGIMPEHIHLRVINTNNKSECTSGMCALHNPTMVDFLQLLANVSQEDRLMKIKKKLRWITQRHTGNVKRGSQLQENDAISRKDGSSGPFTVKEVLAKRTHVVDVYARSIRINSDSRLAESGFGDVDEKYNLAEHSEDIAKWLTPCVKVTFVNGDTASISTQALEDARANGNDLVADPLYVKGASKEHQEFIDWNQVAEIDWTPLTVDEWSIHVTSFMDRKLKEPGFDPTTADWNSIIRESMNNWDTRNRYCQETKRNRNSMNINKVLADITPLRRSLPYTPSYNILPSTVGRFLDGVVAPRHLKSASYINVTGEVLSKDFDRLYVKGNTGTLNIVYVETDVTDKNKGIGTQGLDGVLAEKDTINRAGNIHASGSYVHNGAVLVAATKNMSVKNLARILEKAERAGCDVVIPNDLRDAVTEAFGIDFLPVSPANEHVAVYADSNGNEKKLDECFIINPSDIVDAIGRSNGSRAIPMYYGFAEHYKTVVVAEGLAEPFGDSLMMVTEEMAKLWGTIIDEEPSEFATPFTAEEWHLCDCNDDSALADLQADLEEILLETDDKELERKLRAKVEIGDLMSRSNPNKYPGSYRKLAKSIKLYIEHARSDPEMFSVMSAVGNNDIIGLALSSDTGKFSPVVFNGQKPTSGATVFFEPNAKNGSNVRYRYSYDASIADTLGSIKVYLTDVFGMKSQIVVNRDGLSVDMIYHRNGSSNGFTDEEDIRFPIAALIDPNAIPSRIPDDIKPYVVKLSLFVKLRQKTPFDVFRTSTPTEMLEGIEAIGEDFDDNEINWILSHKTELSLSDRRFWNKFLNGTLKFKIASREQQQAINTMIASCLNNGVNPAILFSSIDHGEMLDKMAASGGKVPLKSVSKDKLDSPFLNVLLSESISGVDIDTLMTYCNFVDNEFCPPDSHQIHNADEFDASGYYTDQECRVRLSIDDKKGNAGDYICIAYETGIRTNGSTDVRSLSHEATVNDRLVWRSLVKNGPTANMDMESVLRGMRAQYDQYSDEEIFALSKSDGEFWSKLGSRSEYTTVPMDFSRSMNAIPLDVVGINKEEIDRVKNASDGFYSRTDPSNFPVWSVDEQGEPMSLEDKEKALADITFGIEGLTSVENWQLIRLVKAYAGWTPTVGEEQESMPGQVFLEACNAIREDLNNHRFPLPCAYGTKNTYFKDHKFVSGSISRPVIGWLEPGFVDSLLISFKDGGFVINDTVEDIGKLVKRNIADMLGDESPLSFSTAKDQVTAIEKDLFCADYAWDGFNIDLIFRHRFLINKSYNDVSHYDRLFQGRQGAELEEIKRMSKEQEKRIEAFHDAVKKMYIVQYSTKGKDAKKIAEADTTYKRDGYRLLNNAIKLKQFMAMTSPVVMGSNFGDSSKGTFVNYMENHLGRKLHVGPYASGQRNRVKIAKDPYEEQQLTKRLYEEEENQYYMEAMAIAESIGGQNEVINFQNRVANGLHPSQYIDENKNYKLGKKGAKKQEGGKEKSKAWDNIFGLGMRFGTTSTLWRKKNTHNFIDNFFRVAGELGLWDLEEGGSMNFKKMVEDNPVQAFNMIWSDPHYEEARRIAFEQTQQNSIAHETALSVFVETALRKHPIFKFFVQSPLGVTFIRANINIARRLLKNIIPGFSTFEYVMTDMLQNADINDHAVLAKILSVAGRCDPKDFQALFANRPELKTYESIRVAMMTDLCHMTMPLFGLVMAMSGAVEPPDDDDLYEDYWEWSFLGAPIGQQWWLMDLIGPILPWTCFMKSFIDGRPNGMIMLNAIEDFMNMSPFVAIEDLVDLVIDPTAVLEGYADDSEYWADTPDGAPDIYMMLAGKSKAYALSWFASFITPKFLTDIEKYNQQYEKSYSRAYVYDDAGNPVYNEDGTLKTEKVPYAVAMVRKVTKNNWFLGFILDAFEGVAGNDRYGYTPGEMPDQMIYDSEQLQFEHTFSVWDYDNDTYKSDEEIDATCAALCMILEQNDDMNALYSEGFYLDKPTKDALSAYIWGLYQNEIDEFNDIIQSGGMDYLYLGNGNWNEGQRIASEMYEAHYAALHYYEDLYYNKLTSRELNQGLVMYKRYNTTYKQDSNGNWYATGFRESIPPWMPIMVGQDGFGGTGNMTTGSEGSWATRSAVTGQGMYDQEGDPYRALVPIAEDGYEWYSFEELANLMGVTKNSKGDDGKGNKDLTDKSQYGGPSGGWGYAYTRGGGGGRGGSVRLANRNYASTSKATPAYGYNYNKRLSPHSMNPVRPNFPNSMQGGRIYDPQLDYLRPNFETKGSREAYRRQDF